MPTELAQIVTEKGILAAGKTVFTAGSDTNPPTSIYDTQGYPLYNEYYWSARATKANCYAYAMNVVVNGDDHRLRPGNVRGLDINRPTRHLDEVAYLLAENVINDSLSGNLGGITNVVRCEFTDDPHDINNTRLLWLWGMQ